MDTVKYFPEFLKLFKYVPEYDDFTKKDFKQKLNQFADAVYELHKKGLLDGY